MPAASTGERGGAGGEVSLIPSVPNVYTVPPTLSAQTSNAQVLCSSLATWQYAVRLRSKYIHLTDWESWGAVTLMNHQINTKREAL